MDRGSKPCWLQNILLAWKSIEILGKHTNLINQHLASSSMLGAMLPGICAINYPLHVIECYWILYAKLLGIYNRSFWLLLRYAKEWGLWIELDWVLSRDFQYVMMVLDTTLCLKNKKCNYHTMIESQQIISDFLSCNLTSVHHYSFNMISEWSKYWGDVLDYYEYC